LVRKSEGRAPWTNRSIVKIPVAGHLVLIVVMYVSGFTFCCFIPKTANIIPFAGVEEETLAHHQSTSIISPFKYFTDTLEIYPYLSDVRTKFAFGIGYLPFLVIVF